VDTVLAPYALLAQQGQGADDDVRLLISPVTPLPGVPIESFELSEIGKPRFCASATSAEAVGARLIAPGWPPDSKSHLRCGSPTPARTAPALPFCERSGFVDDQRVDLFPELLALRRFLMRNPARAPRPWRP